MSKVISISEAASIALHGMVLVAQSEEGLINVNKIAELTSSSRHHVAKVFQVLVKEGWIRSHRGPNGGFKLNIEPAKLNFLQIYELIEGPLDRNYCPFDKHDTCPFNSCLLGGITQKMTTEFVKYLESQTLAIHMKNRTE